MELYSRPDYYDKICSGLEDVIFYQNIARRLNGPILELACGTGRVLSQLQQTGFDCVGLDISADMIATARKRHPRIHFIIGDMREFEIGRRFKFIFIALNSFLHLLTRSDIENFLCSVKSHLDDDGEFAFSIFNPSLAILSRDSNTRYPVSIFFDEQTKQTVTVEETTTYDASTQISHLTWYYSTPLNTDFHLHQLKMRNIFPQELEELPFYNNFEMIERCGDNNGSPFGSDSMLQVVRCRPKK